MHRKNAHEGNFYILNLIYIRLKKKFVVIRIY